MVNWASRIQLNQRWISSTTWDCSSPRDFSVSRSRPVSVGEGSRASMMLGDHWWCCSTGQNGWRVPGVLVKSPGFDTKIAAYKWIHMDLHPSMIWKSVVLTKFWPMDAASHPSPIGLSIAIDPAHSPSIQRPVTDLPGSRSPTHLPSERAKCESVPCIKRGWRCGVDIWGWFKSLQQECNKWIYVMKILVLNDFNGSARNTKNLGI